VLSAAESQLLAALKRALFEQFGDRLLGLKLFGSRARGEGRDDSDIDVLVDVRDVTRDERGAILDLAHDLGLEADLVLSPLVLRAGVTPRPEILRDAVPL
jgi:predicted nucleotidyltransferase